ncbi:MAG TPA: ACT domain-containing protein [Candidatus Korarchaeota archaeon]|nr:ACT domain-containing protein [Candidatus Korarchaeota archaeon]
MEEFVVVTVVGADRPGIVAAISSTLAEANANIVDISMTVLRGFFSMIMVVDISKATRELDELRKELERKGEEVGVRVMVQHEDVFKFMQKV